MKRALIVSLFAVATGCASRTQVMITVDAEPQVRAATRTLRVEVWGGVRSASNVPNEAQQTYPYVVSPSGSGWPRLIALAPQGGDVTRLYRVEARAYATSSESAPVVARAQVISGYAAGKVVWIRLVLQDACIGAECDPIAGETCVDGQCVAARRDETELPEYLADASYPDAGSVMDGGIAGGCRSRDDCAPSDCADYACVRGQCIYSPSDERCNDGAECTLDFCARAGTTMRCVRSPMPTFCDDGVTCTEDFCAPRERGAAMGTGCLFVPNAALCTEGEGPRCDPASDCQYSTCNATNCRPRNACDLGASCNGNECVRTPLCPSGPCCNGTCTNCNDEVSCTQDSCTPGGCVNTPIDAACGPPPVCNVYICSPGSGCGQTPSMNGLACVDSCGSGLCMDGRCECAPQSDGGVSCGQYDENECDYEVGLGGPGCGLAPPGSSCSGPCTGGRTPRCDSFGNCICSGNDGGVRFDAGVESGTGCTFDDDCRPAFGPCAICSVGTCLSQPCVFDGSACVPPCVE